MGLPRLTLAAVAVVAAGATGARAVRPDGPGADQLTFHFDDGDVVETWDDPGGRVRVHFARDGKSAVRGIDHDTDGVPDDVQLVGETYEDVLDHEASMGFRAPRSDEGTPGGDGGDGRYDVYLVDFDFAADGTFVRERCSGQRCSGYMIQENDFVGYGYPSFAYATRVLASHETFHAVQAAYDDQQGANWGEATAVWATEQFDKSLDDFEGFAPGWLESPERSIDQEPTGPVDSFAYGLALLPQYLTERFGPEVVLKVWAGSEDGQGGVADPHWVDVLAAVLESDYGSTFFAAWQELAAWALRAGWGGEAGETWAAAGSLPPIAKKAVDLPFEDDKLRVFHASLRVWSVAPGARGTIAAELVTTPADAAELEGMTLVLGARTGREVVTVMADAGVVAASIDATGASEVLVAVVNTQTAGESQRPGLCIGSPDEVAACRTALGGDPVVEPQPEVGPEVEAVAEDAPEDGPDGGPEPVAEASAEASGDTGATGGGTDEGCAGGGAGLAWSVLAALALGLGRVRAQRW